MKAKAAVYMGAEKDFDVKEFAVTETPSGYGRSELIASGICGTDVHIQTGRLDCPAPAIIGHEFVGKLTDADPAEAAKFGLKVGDNVIADIAVACGNCPLCLSGDSANCVNLRDTNSGDISKAPFMYGGYSEVNYTPLTNLIKIPDSVDPVAAAVFACPGPTVIHGVTIAERANIDMSKVRVAVVQGLGPVGMFAVAYLKRLGIPKVFAISTGKNPMRDAFALELGAEKVFKLSVDGAEKVTAELQAENGGIGVDLCIEASGAPGAFPQGMDILRNRGVYIVPGQYSNSGGVEIQPQLITFKALQIFGSSQYDFSDVRKYLEFLRVNPDLYPVILRMARKYGVGQVNNAFRDAKKGLNVKSLLVKDGKGD
jgi:threonine dehydrogenase-like Zn-dependent dehydrogenase